MNLNLGYHTNNAYSSRRSENKPQFLGKMSKLSCIGRVHVPLVSGMMTLQHQDLSKYRLVQQFNYSWHNRRGLFRTWKKVRTVHYFKLNARQIAVLLPYRVAREFCSWVKSSRVATILYFLRSSANIRFGEAGFEPTSVTKTTNKNGARCDPILAEQLTLQEWFVTGHK